MNVVWKNRYSREPRPAPVSATDDFDEPEFEMKERAVFHISDVTLS